jgi:hypothetical protein
MRATRREVEDEYAEDGQCALLVEQEIVVLSPLASLVWTLLADGPKATRELVPTLVEAFGAPEGSSPDELTDTCLEQLAAQGLVTLESEY